MVDRAGPSLGSLVAQSGAKRMFEVRTTNLTPVSGAFGASVGFGRRQPVWVNELRFAIRPRVVVRFALAAGGGLDGPGRDTGARLQFRAAVRGGSDTGRGEG